MWNYRILLKMERYSFTSLEKQSLPWSIGSNSVRNSWKKLTEFYPWWGSSPKRPVEVPAEWRDWKFTPTTWSELRWVGPRVPEVPGALTCHPWKPSASGWWWGCVDSPTPPGPPALEGGPFLRGELWDDHQGFTVFWVWNQRRVHYESWKMGPNRNKEIGGNDGANNMRQPCQMEQNSPK